MVFPAVCNIGVEDSVADTGDALWEREPKRGRQRKHHQKKTKSINTEGRKPKGINLREGEFRGAMSPPSRANS